MINPNPEHKSRLREVTINTSNRCYIHIIHSETCPHCVHLLARLSSTNISYDTYLVSDPIGLSYARQSKSKTVPVVVLEPYDTQDELRFYSLDNYSEDEIMRVIIDYDQYLKRL